MSTKRQTQIAGYIAFGIAVLPYFIPSLTEHYAWLLALAIFIIGLPYHWAAFQTFRYANQLIDKREEDISAEVPQPTRNAALLINQLHELGFSRLGEVRSPISPTQKAAVWVMANHDFTDLVEVADLRGKLPAIVQFTTLFADEAALETVYPVGQNKDFPQYRHRFNSVSVNAAYDQHTLERFRLESEHGTPYQIRSIAEYINWNIRFRELYGQYKMKGGKFHSLFNSLMLASVFVVALSYAFSTSDPGFGSSTLSWVIAIVGIVAFFSFGLAAYLYSRKDKQNFAAAEHFKKRQDKATRPRRRIF